MQQQEASMPAKYLALMLAGLLALAPACPVWAKSGGSSFSSGGSRSSSSGWSSSSRPSAPAATSTPRSAAPSGWSNSTQSPAPAQNPSPAPSSKGAWSNSTGQSAGQASQPRSGSAFSSSGNTAVNRQAAATSYQEYQGRFAKTGNPAQPGSAGSGPTPTRTFNNYHDYYNYRDNYYAGRGFATPGWAFMSYPRFGLWDSLFLWYMLSHLSGPGFFYNHQSDPGVQAFQTEAQRLAQSNTDLKKQLDEMNTKLDDLKKANTPVDPKAMPEGVDPSLALAQPPVTQAQARQEAPEPQPSSGSGNTLTWALVFLTGILGVAYFVARRR
jgi:hypothetical protein